MMTVPAPWAGLLVLLRQIVSGRSDRRFKIIRSAIVTLAERVTELEERMSDMESGANDRMNALVATVVAEVNSLREGVRQKDAALAMAESKLAESDATAAQMVREALDADSARDAERVIGWVDQLSAAIPGPTPEVTTPPVGEAATPPEGSGLVEPETPEADTVLTDPDIV